MTTPDARSLAEVEFRHGAGCDLGMPYGHCSDNCRYEVVKMRPDPTPKPTPDAVQALAGEDGHSADYNRGWADGNAAALDACNPIIEQLQARLSQATPAPEIERLREGYEYEDIDALNVLAVALYRYEWAVVAAKKGTSVAAPGAVAKALADEHTSIYSNGTEHEFAVERAEHVFEVGDLLRRALVVAVRTDERVRAYAEALMIGDHDVIARIEAEEIAKPIERYDAALAVADAPVATEVPNDESN